ncbi:MAG TPA: MEDS domain-containing protein [Candidatus Thermoplasmatota archaeon]|nr:MEDS domain-containing protein [Candidatus Thermoplasmatota archaeon]
MSSTWAPILEDAQPRSHIALVYRDDAFLAHAVAVWSAPALRSGGGAILVGTPSHGLTVRNQLRKHGLDVDDLERRGKLVLLDADWLMARFVLDGTPDATRFRALAAEIVHGMRAAVGPAEIRAWGEMVSLLHLRGNAPAARRLEDLWMEVISQHGIALMCSYDLAGGGDHAGFMRDVAHQHGRTLLQPEGDDATAAAATR